LSIRLPCPTQASPRLTLDRLEGKAAQQVDVNVIDNREISEFSDAEMTAMLKERVIHAPIDASPRSETDTLN
jgi:hypothetical protein